MNVQERKEWVSAAFQRQFGAQPQVWGRAPGRVDLMGSHTDYNQGYVLTMTLDRDTWIAARRRDDRRVNVYSLNVPGGGNFDLDDIRHDDVTPWTNYIRGVAASLQEAGHTLTGFDGLVHSTVPFGSGLSSSAAIEMACMWVFRQIGELAIEPLQMALLGQRAENHFVGVNSGILDQYSSALGQAGSALLLDCRALTSRIAPLAAGLSVVICDTRAQRSLAGSEYGERRAQCEQGVRILQRRYPVIQALRDVTGEQFTACEAELPPVVARRCRFIIEENQRVLDLAAALPGGDPRRLNDLLAASYAGARDLYEIGAPAMQTMMTAMSSAPGVIAARQAGAGFGGCMVALVHSQQVPEFARHVDDTYQKQSGIQPAVYEVRPTAGAGPL